MSANNFTLKGIKKMTTNNNTVSDGTKVTLHYQGTLDDGTVFDSSHQRGEPMTVTAGAGGLIPGFEQAISGMTEGETKTFTVTPEEAYGDRNEEATTTLSRSMFPEDFPFEDDMVIPLQSSEGNPVLSTLLEHNDTEVTVDLNHPMAGKNLTFEVEVISVTSGDE
jgi:peptidylprolyl isomerase